MEIDQDRRKRQRWNVVGSVSSLGAIVISRYFQGPLSVLCMVAFAVTFFVSIYFTFRSSAGPFHSHNRLTR
jgi:hypothetical protein